MPLDLIVIIISLGMLVPWVWLLINQAMKGDGITDLCGCSFFDRINPFRWHYLSHGFRICKKCGQSQKYSGGAAFDWWENTTLKSLLGRRKRATEQKNKITQIELDERKKGLTFLKKKHVFRSCKQTMIPETSLEPSLKEDYIAATSDGVAREQTEPCLRQNVRLLFHSVASWRESQRCLQT